MKKVIILSLLITITVITFFLPGFNKIILKDFQDIKLGSILISLTIISFLFERFIQIHKLLWLKNKKTKEEIQLITTITGFIFGLIIAICGFSIIQFLIIRPENETQFKLIQFIDRILTASLLSGGSNAIHQFNSLIGNYMKETKGKIKS